MTTYVALLRGINVGGKAKVRMHELRELFVAAGHADAQTYIQTGNVIFSSSADADRLTGELEARIAADLGVNASVLVRTKDELAQIIAGNPFAGRDFDPATVAVNFLSGTPEQDRVEQLNSSAYEPDEFVVAGREVYLHCPNGFGRSKLTNTLFERKLAVRVTARNWKVVTKLAELASSGR